MHGPGPGDPKLCGVVRARSDQRPAGGKVCSNSPSVIRRAKQRTVAGRRTDLLVQRQTTETHAYTHADTRRPHCSAHTHLTHVPHAANPRPGGGVGGQRASYAGQERRPRACRRSREGAVACCGSAWLAAACRWSISMGAELEEGRGPGCCIPQPPLPSYGRAHHARKTAALPPHYHV